MKAIAIGTVVPISNRTKVTNETDHLAAYLIIRGQIQPAAFTARELQMILDRALKNREDMPPLHHGRYLRWRPRKSRKNV